ncbi:DUF3592 domain-containing protein [Kitasatospora sp. NPDC090308]|uniref:DUF3592 domain-containing protein n=1 Tax=Kitasatospora sp. NPDC090308 TaxID=3364082 RepID=UPI00381C8FA3
MAYRAMLVAGLVTGAGGLALLGAGLPGALLLRRRWAAEGTTAEARCLETYVQERRNDRPSVRRAIVEFRTPDGTAHRAHLQARDLVAGDVLTVRYRPRRPSRALHANRSDGTAALLVAIVVLTLALLTTAAVTLHLGLAPDPEPADGWHFGGTR